MSGVSAASTASHRSISLAARDDAARKLAANSSWISKYLFMNNTELLGYPKFRGKIHLILVYTAPIWMSCLFRSASNWRGYVAALVASGSALFQFSASALLHNGVWSKGAIEWMAKLDYASIFIMISGSCSTVSTLLFPKHLSAAYLIIQITATVAGAVCVYSGLLIHAPRARSLLYVAIGLSNLVFFPAFVRVTTLYELVCLLSMAALYVIGSGFYAFRWPALWPRIFGYHELFHFCCLGAAGCTFALNRSVLLRAG